MISQIWITWKIWLQQNTFHGSTNESIKFDFYFDLNQLFQNGFALTPELCVENDLVLCKCT